jgi:hypothetical protein
MPPIHERSTVPHPSLRIRWGQMALAAFVLLCSASVFGGAFFPLAFVLWIAWFLWRAERDAGCPPLLRKERR